MHPSSTTILLVDDYAAHRLTLSGLLCDAGYTVAEATSGTEAIEYLAANPPPIAILLDLIMPGMSGWDFLAWRRSQPAAAAVPVIVLSGATQAELTAGLIAGESAVHFIGKPVDLDRLLELVGRLGPDPAPALREADASPREVDLTGVLRLLVDTPEGDSVHLLDPRGLVTTWSAPAQRLEGHEAQEIVGRHASLFYPEPDRDLCATSLEVAAREERHSTECWRVRRDGSRFWACVVITALRDLRGELVGFAVAVRDGTEHRKTVEDLNRLFDLSPDLLALAGFDGYLKQVNPAWTTILGHTREELLARPYLDLVHPDDREATVAEARALGANVATVSFEHRCRGRSGEHRWIQWSVTPLPRQQHLFCVGRDVTDKKGLEEQLRQTQKMEAIGRLAGGIAHDFNNLLTAMGGYSDLALEKLHEQDPVRPHIEQTKRAGLRAADLTKQLLAFSRKQMLEVRVVSPSTVVTDMLGMLRRLIPESVRIVTRLAPDAGNVDADPGQLQQVIMNLALNARDAMPDGGELVISTHVAPDRADVAAPAGSFVTLAVSDTGTGMDEETRRHLFEPFFSTKGELGTGLGLATVYGIVSQSGGRIAVDSAPGRGTTFEVFLPRVERSVAPVEGGAPAQPSAGSETVLLVEDEESVRDLAREVLTARGYEVLVASGGGEALRTLEERPGPVHLLLTDVIMPHMSGAELARRFVAKHPSSRVLFMSGYTASAFDADGVPGTQFIQKPFSLRALADKVRQVLDAPGG